MAASGDESTVAACVPLSVARHLKPHQRAGVWFLLRSLVQSEVGAAVLRDPALSGLTSGGTPLAQHWGRILADHMGLGKTLQVIATLAAVRLERGEQCRSDGPALAADAGAPVSPPAARGHVGQVLRGETGGSVAVVDGPPFRPHDFRRCLIIAPNTVARNWLAEFGKWLTPQEFEDMGVIVMDSTVWVADGGVLVIGYELFRSLVEPRATQRPSSARPHESPAASDSDWAAAPAPTPTPTPAPGGGATAALVYSALCDPGPDVIVLDEGHRMRSPTSRLYSALRLIATRRRIALSGYPLQNRLLEYFAMIDLVRPGMLGERAQFKAAFVDVIDAGRLVDASKMDVLFARRASMRLQALLSGVVLRRDVSVLTRALPPLHETVVRCRLTDTQARLYKAFLRDRQRALDRWEAQRQSRGLVRARSVGAAAQAGGEPAGSNRDIIGAYQVSLMLVNHPDLLYAAADAELREGSGRSITQLAAGDGSAPAQNPGRGSAPIAVIQRPSLPPPPPPPPRARPPLLAPGAAGVVCIDLDEDDDDGVGAAAIAPAAAQHGATLGGGNGGNVPAGGQAVDATTFPPTLMDAYGSAPSTQDTATRDDGDDDEDAWSAADARPSRPTAPPSCLSTRAPAHSSSTPLLAAAAPPYSVLAATPAPGAAESDGRPDCGNRDRVEGGPGHGTSSGVGVGVGVGAAIAVVDIGGDEEEEEDDDNDVALCGSEVAGGLAQSAASLRDGETAPAAVAEAADVEVVSLPDGVLRPPLVSALEHRLAWAVPLLRDYVPTLAAPPVRRRGSAPRAERGREARGAARGKRPRQPSSAGGARGSRGDGDDDEEDDDDDTNGRGAGGGGNWNGGGDDDDDDAWELVDAPPGDADPSPPELAAAARGADAASPSSSSRAGREDAARWGGREGARGSRDAGRGGALVDAAGRTEACARRARGSEVASSRQRGGRAYVNAAGGDDAVTAVDAHLRAPSGGRVDGDGGDGSVPGRTRGQTHAAGADRDGWQARGSVGAVSCAGAIAASPVAGALDVTAARSTKLAFVWRVAEHARAAGERVVVFSQSQRTLVCIQRYLAAPASLARDCGWAPPAAAPPSAQHQPVHKQEGGYAQDTATTAQPIRCLRIDGTTPSLQRQRAIQMFNDPQCPVDVMLVATRAGGEGVNLVGGSRVVLFDVCWNPSLDQQAMCRCFRFGQRRAVHVYRLVSEGTIEEKVFNQQIFKVGLSRRVLDATDTRRQFTAE